MNLFLQILGGLCLTVVVLVGLVLAVLLVLRKKLKTAMEGLSDLKYAVVPPRIHLSPEPVPAWKDAPAVEALAQPLRDAGFEDIGAFGTQEMDYLRLRALAHPAHSVYAAVYEHDKAGVFMDLVTRYQDGTSVTYSTNVIGEELRQRPGHLTVRDAASGSGGLLQRMLAERPQAPMEPATADAFTADFEQAYADSMDWRNSQEFDPDEIRRAAGRELTDEEMEAMREAQEAQAAEALMTALYERFSRQTTTTGAEWDRIKENLVFVHERLSPDQLQELVDDWYNGRLRDEAHEVDPEFKTGISSRQAFIWFNDSLPEARRFKKIGELAEPVACDVYLPPEGREFRAFEEDEDY
jgi:hypothetical protein